MCGIHVRSVAATSTRGDLRSGKRDVFFVWTAHIFKAYLCHTKYLVAAMK
jgi:hypothetical protein